MDRGDEVHHRKLLDVLKLPSESAEAEPQARMQGDVPCAMCETFVVWVEHQVMQNKTKMQILYVRPVRVCEKSDSPKEFGEVRARYALVRLLGIRYPQTIYCGLQWSEPFGFVAWLRLAAGTGIRR